MQLITLLWTKLHLKMFCMITTDPLSLLLVCSHPQSVRNIPNISMRYPHMLHRRNFLAILLRGNLHCQCGYIWYVWTEPCWELLNIRIYIARNEQGGFEISRIMVKLQRPHAFLMVNKFSPILLLTIVNLFGFMIPMDSAESVSYAITVLLSFTVFLSLVMANTRKSSLTVSLFSVYM